MAEKGITLHNYWKGSLDVQRHRYTAEGASDGKPEQRAAEIEKPSRKRRGKNLVGRSWNCFALTFELLRYIKFYCSENGVDFVCLQSQTTLLHGANYSLLMPVIPIDA